MKTIEIILIGISLAMDAFAITICKGLKENNFKTGLIISLFFSLFQFVMPIIGYNFGNLLNTKIINYQTYFCSILLITIGILMIKGNDTNNFENKLKIGELIMLSIATSIDALVIGISFSFIKINIINSATIIGIITFIICLIGYFLGSIFNKKAHQYSNIIGGITLIIIGIKLLF